MPAALAIALSNQSKSSRYRLRARGSASTNTTFGWKPTKTWRSKDQLDGPQGHGSHRHTSTALANQSLPLSLA
jgi:hypothetical protein